MKKLILFLFLIGGFLTAQAQLKFGLKLGLNTTSLSPSDFIVLNQDDVDRLKVKLEDANYGFQAGLIIQARIGNFVLQPELIFNSNSVDFDVTDVNTSEVFSQLNEKYQYLDIPVMLGCKFGPLRLQAGPVAHVFLNSTSELFDFSGYEQKFNEFTYGWLLGLGLDIWNVALDFRYEGNFSNFGDHITFDGREYEFNQSPSRFLLSLGIFF